MLGFIKFTLSTTLAAVVLALTATIGVPGIVVAEEASGQDSAACWSSGGSCFCHVIGTDCTCRGDGHGCYAYCDSGEYSVCP